MKNMKIFSGIGFALLTLVVTQASLMAAGRSYHGIDYMMRDPGLENITVGAYLGRVERELDVKGSPFSTVISSRRLYAYAGYDVLRWLNVYGMAGANEAQLQGGSYADSEMLLGIGVTANLLNHFIREPIPLEDTFQIHANFELVNTSSDFGLLDVTWQEISANVTFALVNHIVGNKEFVPEAISLYAGPSFSYINSSDVEAANELGLTGGLEIYFQESFGFDINFEIYEESSLMAGFNFRF